MPKVQSLMSNFNIIIQYALVGNEMGNSRFGVSSNSFTIRTQMTHKYIYYTQAEVWHKQRMNPGPQCHVRWYGMLTKGRN